MAEHSYWQDFPPTQWTDIVCHSERRQQALTDLARRYWRPVYCYLRQLKCDRQTAEDLTQQFFIEVQNTNFLDRAEPSKGKFRNYTKRTLQNLRKEWLRAQNAVSRAPKTSLLSLDISFDEEDNRQFPEPGVSEDDIFEKEWAHATVEEALSQLRQYCRKDSEENSDDRQQALEAFELHFLEGEKAADIATQIDRDVKWVYERIYRLKHKYRQFLENNVRATLSEGESIEDEINSILKSLQ